MNKLTKIYVVRHGESGFNYLSKTKDVDNLSYDGIAGSPLTERGKQQTRNLAKKLKPIKFATIFSSDLARAKETAEILALEKKLAVDINEVLRERSIFDYLRKTPDKKFNELTNEIKQGLKELDDKAKHTYKHTPDMESAEEGALRLLTFVREASAAYLGKNILIVCHGNIMRSLLTHLGWAKYDELPTSSIENTGYFILESDGVDFYVKETWGINKQEGAFRDF